MERLNLPRFIPLPPSFELNSASNKGLIFDELWKRALLEISDRFIIPPEPDAPYDAFLKTDYEEYYDVKIIPTLGQSYKECQVYVSHNEYLFGKEHNTRFAIYVEDGDIGDLLITFTFSFAKELGAFTIFDQGSWVHCKATGKLEAPWAINVSRILQKSVAAPE